MSQTRASGGKAMTVADNQTYRILIVDDEEINLKILRIYLEDKGYEVVSALNGEEAINILRSEEVTACICDIRMPKISGIDVLNFVQQHTPIVPVVMLTGFIDINTAVSVMRQGASNYLTKPIDAGELIISVEKAIEHRKLLEEKLRLEKENLEYQRDLEVKIEEKTQDLQMNMLDMVVALSNAVEERDAHLIGHSKRIAQYSNMLARQLGMNKEQLRTLHYGAILHDIGKIGIPDEVLKKSGDLSPDELEVMKAHPQKGFNILQPVNFLKEVGLIVRHHHENWNGTGYPVGLKETNIPQLARIVRLVDGFDVLTSTRANKRAMDVQAAVEQVRKDQGTLYDPELVEPFIALVEKMRTRVPKRDDNGNNP
jgi:putative nucleotidyltransferase with HDIG domain